MPSSPHLSDSAEFVAVMGGGETAPRHSDSTVVGGGTSTILPPRNDRRPTHAWLSNERTFPPHNLQTVRFLSPYTFHPLRCQFIPNKKYNTIVQGFKALETYYEESKKKLAISEESAFTARIAYAELVSEAKVSQTAIRCHEQVWHCSGWETPPRHLLILNI